jgi:urease accessory protein
MRRSTQPTKQLSQATSENPIAIAPKNPISGGSSSTTGWNAALSLGFEAASLVNSHRKTVLRHREHTGPLVVQKALYPEGDGICHVIIVHPPGGICGGDALSINISSGANTHALLTTPGATKWYRAKTRHPDLSAQHASTPVSSQTIHIKLDSDAKLEWLPQEAIVYDRAQGRNHTVISLADQARYLGWEILCLGRAAHGETFSEGRYAQSFVVERDGVPLWVERGALDAASALTHATVGFGSFTVHGTLVAAGMAGDAKVVDALRAALEPHQTPQNRFAVSRTPHVTVVRYAGNTSEAARNGFIAAWRVLRPWMMDCEAVLPRLWAT